MPDNSQTRKTYGELVIQETKPIQMNVLYSVKPIGLGTKYAECLTSYIGRVAKEHSLIVHDLITKVILPSIKGEYDSKQPMTGRTVGDGYYRMSSAINSIGNVANDFACTMERLTGQSGIACLTMLPWSSVLAAKGLLRDHRAWCPHCFQEMLARDPANPHAAVYEPLIWQFKALEICPVHETPLVSLCPHEENAKPMPPLARHFSPGHCARCKRWLGTEAAGLTRLGGMELEWQKWVALQAGSLIESACAITPSQISRRSGTKTFIKGCVDGLADGKVKRFAKLMGLKHSTVHGWYYGQPAPSLTNLLQISFILNKPLLACMRGEVAEEIHPYRLSYFLEKMNENNRSSQTTPFDQRLLVAKKYIEEQLDETKGKPLSVQDVARLADVDYRLLYKHYNELCKRLAVKHREYRQAQAFLEHMTLSNRIRATVQKLNKEGTYPSQKAVEDAMGKPAFLRSQPLKEEFQNAKESVLQKQQTPDSW